MPVCGTHLKPTAKKKSTDGGTHPKWTVKKTYSTQNRQTAVSDVENGMSIWKTSEITAFHAQHLLE